MKGIKRMLNSSKGVAALTTVFGLVLIRLLGMDAEAARDLSVALIILAALYIGGTAYEDGKKALGLLIASSVLFLAGCCPAVGHLAGANQLFISTAGGEYENYVRADTSLSDLQKQIRYQQVDSFRRATAEALK